MQPTTTVSTSFSHKWQMCEERRCLNDVTRVSRNGRMLTRDSNVSNVADDPYECANNLTPIVTVILCSLLPIIHLTSVARESLQTQRDGRLTRAESVMRKTPTTSRKKATIPPYLLKRYAIFVNDHLDAHISETSSESVKRQSYKYKAGRDERIEIGRRCDTHLSPRQ